jgi:Fe-S-cluster containining protein
VAAKKDISTIERLGPYLTIPIENEISAAGSTECRAGCAHCCNLRVAAFPHEIVAIHYFLKRTLPREQLNKIRARIDAQYKVVQPLSESEHFSTNVECPLLMEGRCSVYPVRPISCSGYHSTSEAKCRESNEHPEMDNGAIPMVDTVKERQLIQHSIAREVITAEKDDASQYELIGGLHRIFRDPGLIQRWVNGRSFFKK